MRSIWAMAAVLALGGCASKGMSKAECRLADWHAIGFEDGARGASARTFGAHRKACAEHGVAAGFDDYLAGHARGIESFCRPENGARLGASGVRYTGVCPAHLEGAFLDAYAESYGLYERQATVDALRRQIRARRARSNEIEHLLVDRTARLVSPLLTPAERASLAVELKQLTDEKIELEASIPRLERECEQAERDYESYRDQLAMRDVG